MTIDSDIRDQAYQFFIQEAPELLQVIETDLLALREDRTTAKIHNMMRAAHSIKGGAASVGLETIKTLAHSLEDIFKGLHNEELEIDEDVESLLLQAYDCLRLPLMEQLNTGQFDSERAMAVAEPVFAQIEAQIGEYLKSSAEMPSSVELGVDIAASIFEVDVAQGLERLTNVIATSHDREIIEGELRAQAEVFAGLAELLNLPGFGAIASTTLAALQAHPQQAIDIAHIALADFQSARMAVLAGERTQGGAPSAALTQLAQTGVSAPETPAIVIPLESVVSVTETATTALDDVFGFATTPETTDVTPSIESTFADIAPIVAQEVAPEVSLDDLFGFDTAAAPTNVELPAAIAVPEISSNQTEAPAVEQIFATPATPTPTPSVAPAANTTAVTPKKADKAVSTAITASPTSPKAEATTHSAAQLSVRVDLERLERMNNLVGELAINRNSLSLQNNQLQATIQELLRRFAKFQGMARQLRDLSDLMVIAPEHHARGQGANNLSERKLDAASLAATTASALLPSLAAFDSLEMDSYGEVYSLLQGTLEEMVQLEETVGDVVLLAGQSSETIEGQRQMLSHLRDELMWARMLPLGEVLNRFPRMLRDLSRSYDKPVDLKLSGTGVLVDKAVLEKLYDPLLHLVRNAFDHGIEPPDLRLESGKPTQGKIEIRAYHQGNQTIIEVKDDGRGLNLDRVRGKAIEMGLLSSEQANTASTVRLLDLLFEPGFSTAKQISELSGRGVGLDVVRAQLRSLKGNVSVASEPGRGTVFTLRIPLTLTIAKLLVCFVGTNAYAVPSDSIAEILIPQPNQVKYSSGYRFLHWQDRIIPVYRLSDVVSYACPLPETVPDLSMEAVPTPEDWASPMLLLEQESNILAIEVDRLVTEQELVIKPFGNAIAPPSYIYGCTILGNGSLIPVIDGAQLLGSFVGQSVDVTAQTQLPADDINDPDAIAPAPTPTKKDATATVLVVDDSITLRQTLALTLQKAGYRVLQARDGREAIEQLQQSAIQLVVCDVEMPNMNGFEFLSHRRQDPQLVTIPVVMLTSRSSDKHRQLAKHLGATNYFTKPYIEQEFVTAIKNTIQQNTLAKIS